MHLRYDELINDHFTANFLLSLMVKGFWKLVNIWWSYWYNL